MKNKLLIACVVIVLGILAFGTISASAAESGTCGDNLTWTLDDEGTLTISGTGAMYAWSYSSSAPWSYKKSNIENVIINDGVTSIGDYAFYGCTSLASVTIPDSVTSIGKYAFSDCTSLESVTIPDGVTSIGDYAFWDCTSLTSITIPDSVTSIGKYAFTDCTSLESVTIPDGVTSIGDSAFWDCTSLESVTIPDSVTSIGFSTFCDCTSLTSITIPDSVTSIGEWAFSDCTSLTSVTIPDSVTSIGYSSFGYCTSLESIEIPDSVTSIGDSAFYNCTKLKTVYYSGTADKWNKISIGSGNSPLKNARLIYSIASGECGTNLTWNLDSDGTLTIRGMGEMTDWSNLNLSNPSSAPWYSKRLSIKNVIIENGVTSIGSYAFYDCTSFTSITIPDSVTSIGNSAFRNCYSLTSITIPGSVTSIGDFAFYDCTSLTSITIPGSVTSIGDFAFYDCTSLTSVTIPDSVTSIGDYAFSGCESLTSVTIGNSVRSIGNSAFSSCESLTNVTIGNSVTSIGVDAFYNCTSLTSIEIPDSVRSIGDSAFYNCASLTSITIGNSVRSIGSYAFYGCDSLASINVDENNQYYSSDENGALFYKDKTTLIQYPAGNSATSYIIPDSVTSIGNSAFRNCYSLTSITIPGSVTSIGSYAFYDCTGFTSITIPDSVTSIGNSAFSNCYSLTSITIGNSVTSIGDFAFHNCTKLKTVYYSGTADKWNKISFGSYNSSLTSANRIYAVNVKIVYENGKEVSFAHFLGNAIDTSYIPKKQYYTPVFYKDENRTAKISVDTPIFESTTLYLGYEPTLYTHIFRDENGAVIKTESVPYGTVITPPEAPEKEATDEYTYTFAGWKDFTSGMTQEDIELVFVAQYDAVRNDLEQFKMVCDDSVEIGSIFDLTASFATNISAQYIYMTVGIPDGFAVRELTPIDFAEISLDSEEHKNGYTYYTYLGIYDYNGTDIPKNQRVVPFEMVIDCSTSVVKGDYLITLSDVSLIDNNGEFIPFENVNGATVTVKAKLAESITISGPSSIDKPTSFTATVYPDYTSNKEVLWSVSDETVAEINENGLLTPIKNGTVIVSATAADGSGCVASKSVEIIKYAEITSLSSDVGVWDKAFSPDVYEYTIAVFGDVSSITLTPTFNGGVLRPNGTGLWISGTKKSFALGEDTTTITLVRQNVTDNTNSTYTVNVVKAKSEFDGAQIRTDDPQGLRFVFSIPRAVYDAIEHPESPDDIGLGFGSVVMPKKYLGDNELTKETEVTLNGRVYKSKIAPAVNLLEITDDEVKFTACLIEIPEKNYVEEYVAVPYMTYMENGEEITVYGEKTEGITVFTIAEMAYEDDSTPNVVRKYLLKNILNVVRPDKYGSYLGTENYAIVLTYDEDPVTKYVVDGEGAEKIEDERIVYSATGVVDGEFVTYFYVNVLVDGAVKAVQLADYANTFVNYDGEYSLNEEIEDQKITDKEVAETVMYNDFLNKFSTFTVDSDGAYTFTALDIETDTSVFEDKEEETAVYMTAESATIKNFTGSIYNITGVEGLSKFTLKDYSKLIIKTVDDDGDDVYTVYTAANLPDFAETTFNNVMAIFVNNTKSTYENLGILYAEIDGHN